MKIVDQYGIRADHIGIHIYDMEAATRWYQEVFGFTFDREIPLPVGHFPKARYVILGDFWFELYEVKNARPFNQEDYDGRIGIKHCGIAVRKYDEWLRAAKANKEVQFIEEEEDCAIITDTSGVIYCAQRDRLFDDTSILRSGPYEARVQSLAFNVYDIEETAAWYGEVFGFERTPENDRTCKRTGVKIGTAELKHFVLELYETPKAKPFDFVNFEFYVGSKHLDIGLMDRMGWTDYIKTCKSRIPIIVSYGDKNPLHPVTPHYVLDNSNMLVEMSDEHFYID